MTTSVLPVPTWAHLELGDPVQAARVAAAAVTRARSGAYRLALVGALRVQAMVALRQEQWAEAAHAREEGLALAWSRPSPYGEGRLLHVDGEMHLHRGELEPARERLEGALAIFRRPCTRKDVERVEQALTALQGASLRDAAGPVQPALPPRQRAVAGAPANKHLLRTQRQAWALEHLRTLPTASPDSPHASQCRRHAANDVVRARRLLLHTRGVEHIDTRGHCVGGHLWWQCLHEYPLGAGRCAAGARVQQAARCGLLGRPPQEREARMSCPGPRLSGWL